MRSCVAASRRNVLGIRALWVLLLGALLLMTAPVTPVSSQEVAVEELESLVATIEDEAKRQELLSQLRALVAARKGVEETAPPEGFGARLIAELSANAAEAGRQLVAGVQRLGNVPALWAWLGAQVGDAESRRLWGLAFFNLIVILAVGWLAERAAARLLERPQSHLEARETASLLVRVPLALARAVLQIVPLAVFAAVAYGMLPLMRPSGSTQIVILSFVNAYLIARLLMIAMRLLLAPGAAGLRLFPLGGETANYLFIWARRLIMISVFGYYAVEAALLLGLPRQGHAVLLKLLGLLVAVLVIVFLSQNRIIVAGWIRGEGRSRLRRALGGRLRQRLADVWHVLAIVYVAGLYAIWALGIEGGFEYLLRATVLTAVIVVAARLVALGMRRAVERGFAVNADLRTRFPALEARVNRYTPVVHNVLRAVVYLIAGLTLLQVWGIDVFGWLESPVGRRVVGSGVSILIVAVIALVLWEAVSTAIERYLGRTDAEGNLIERSARARTLLPLMRNALLVVLLVMVTLIVLSEVGINIGPLLAGAGVVGLAIGFGSQKLVQDVITGAFMLFEDAISVGDVVNVAGIGGIVERLSIRSIRLRDLSGNVHTIPFSAVETVTNMTKDFSMYVFEIGVAYRENVDDVMEVLREIGADLQEDPEFGPRILEPLEVLGVDQFADSAVIIKARIRTRPIQQWAVGREFNRRMKNRFDELGIEIPFPHTTLYFGQEKDGSAPPVFVETSPKRQRKPAARKKGSEDKPRDLARDTPDETLVPDG